MKLRIAKKIYKFIGTPRETVYTHRQLHLAIERFHRTKSEKENRVFWFGLMDEIGVIGRARVLAGSGAPGMAFDLLMRTPEEQWEPMAERTAT